MRQVAHHLGSVVIVILNVWLIQTTLVVLLLLGLVVIGGLGTAMVRLVLLVRVHGSLSHLAVHRTARLLFSATCTAAEERFVQVAVEILCRLTLELRFRVLMGAKADTWSGCPLRCHHHVLVNAHASVSRCLIVHLRYTIIVIMVYLWRSNTWKTSIASFAMIWMALRWLVWALCDEVVEEDLLVFQDLSL